MTRLIRSILSQPRSLRPLYAPGFLAYATILMWFLLTVLSPVQAQEDLAQEDLAQEDLAQEDLAQENMAAETVAVAPADIRAEIEAALQAEGLGPEAEIIFDTPQAPVYAAAAGVPPAIEDAGLNPVNGRFLVRIRASEKGPLVAIGGTARARVEYPVLIRAIERGETIAAEDIDFIESAEIRSTAYIRDADALVGKEARRPLARGGPLRPSDVVAPVLVKRGDLVAMTYVAAGLKLTHNGVALQSGAKGDVIEIRNVRSERVLKAVVSGRNAAAVASPQMLAAGGEG